MVTPKRLLALVVAAATTTLHISAAQAQAPASERQPCEPAASGANVPVCGLQAPEDIALHPDGRHLLIALTNGPVYYAPSGIVLYDTQQHRQRRLAISVAEAEWGEEGCVPPSDEFDFHGIDVHRLEDGTVRLLTVNHRQRESVEMFEVQQEGNEITSLVWRGCVRTGTEYMMNDVAGFGDGGFLVTFMAPLAALKDINNIRPGITGHVMRWTPDAGLSKLPGTEGAYNNGIALSADEHYAFYAHWTGFRLTQYDLQQSRVVAEAELPIMPDNVTVDSDGTVYTVGFNSLDDAKRCLGSGFADCSNDWHAVAIESDTMAVDTVVLRQELPFFGPTVAVPVGGWLYIGALTGDRIMRYRLSD
ncbi:MAG: SMP-30/gluconolactonase/LRE family protein [Spongiibacteraceae bacterium]|nr:SMP-30/gluconolactonase/LRE family protein [Spongiibacteraceae bacterium]